MTNRLRLVGTATLVVSLVLVAPATAGQVRDTSELSVPGAEAKVPLANSVRIGRVVPREGTWFEIENEDGIRALLVESLGPKGFLSPGIAKYELITRIKKTTLSGAFNKTASAVVEYELINEAGDLLYKAEHETSGKASFSDAMGPKRSQLAVKRALVANIEKFSAALVEVREKPVSYSS